MEITSATFGNAPSGAPVDLYTLRAPSGMHVTCTNFGATITGIFLPAGASGCFTNVAPCHQTMEGLTSGMSANPKMGATCGRVCNRTADATFTLDGKAYALEKNDGEHCLHGGSSAPWDQLAWSLQCLQATPDKASVCFALTSPAGSGGFPGTVSATCTIALTAAHVVTITYHAITDAATPLALTNHCYFNLAGMGHQAAADLGEHVLTLHAESIVPTDPVTFIPTGGLEGIPPTLHFSGQRTLGAMLAAIPPSPPFPAGVNTSFVVEGTAAGRKGHLRPAAVLAHPPTRRTLSVRTTAPCIHVYTCFAWSPEHGSVEGVPLQPSAAIALECQLPTDTANRAFGPIARGILRPGEVYSEVIEYAFAW